MTSSQLYLGDCRDVLDICVEANSVQTCVTSPPYFGLRDYGHASQIGLETTPDEYVVNLVRAFRSVREVLRDDGTLWLNLGDSYANDSKWGGQTSGKHVQAIHGNSGIGRSRHTTGLRGKNLIGIPWRVAFALQADGWVLRQDIIWHKPNPMPESVTDRCTKAHEYVFMFSKQARYYFDAGAVREPVAESQRGRVRADPVGGKSHRERGQHSNERCGNNPRAQACACKAASLDPGRVGDQQACGGFPVLECGCNGCNAPTVERGETRNRRSVWTINTAPYKGAHFAAFPPALVEPCILAGSKAGDTVLDPFAGSGTTGAVALQHGRHFVGCELNPAYLELARARIAEVATHG